MIHKERGFIALTITIIIFVAVLSITLSISFLTLSEQVIMANNLSSVQSYYAAEAGIEDALLRVFNPDIEYSGSYNFNVGIGTASVWIDKVSTTLTIESTGNINNKIKKVEITAIESVDEANFYYGIQVGEGGLVMDGNSQVLGNIYSNGPIKGSSNAKIYGDVYSAGPTGLIEDLNVYKSEPSAEDGNAHTHSIVNCDIENGAYYQEIATTAAGSYYPDSPDSELEDMPISQERIDEWKSEALAGGTTGDRYIDSGANSLGPIKINGDLTVTSNAVLTITGTVWVTGNILFDSNAIIELDSSFGVNSGMLIADGQIVLSSNINICGSEGHKSNKCNLNEGSFLMLLSTSSSLNPSLPAIEASSNSEAAIAYTNNGMIILNSNARLKEVTGYSIHLNSNAVVTYISGLASAKFTSGPSGGWKIVSWREIE